MIHMPEAFIIMRWDAELSGLTEEWRKAFRQLNDTERDFVEKVVSTGNFTLEEVAECSTNAQTVLKYHLIKRENINPAAPDAKKRHIKEFELSCPAEISHECRELIENFRHLTR
jgi:hypothetical protein